VFADDWFFATGERIPEPPAGIPEAVHPAHVIVGGADRANEPMSKSVVGLLHEATARAWMATGYFVPDDALLVALALAAGRGVDVRLLVAERNNHPWLVVAGRSYYEELLNAGVRIFEYSAGTNHAKIAVVDEQWAMVGSANLDYRSLRLNFELNLLVHSPGHNAALAQILADDFSLCREIDRRSFGRRPWRDRLLEAALRPLSSAL
jgi:cardiolipin synthase